jgi:hypothetical protein
MGDSGCVHGQPDCEGEVRGGLSGVAGQIAGFRTMVDGSARVSVDIPLEQVALWMTNVGRSVALAPLLPIPEEMTWREEASELRKSGFCRRPQVWMEVGTDEGYLIWLRFQKCAFPSGHCDGDVVAAHVRRIADGAGMGHKPPFSALPLCHYHHSLQHQQGEAAVAPPERWDAEKLKHLEEWAWSRLKKQFDVEHMYELDPKRLWMWALSHDVEKFLPPSFHPSS